MRLHLYEDLLWEGDDANLVWFGFRKVNVYPLFWRKGFKVHFPYDKVTIRFGLVLEDLMYILFFEGRNLKYIFLITASHVWYETFIII